MTEAEIRRLAIALDDHPHDVSVQRGREPGSFTVRLGAGDAAPRTRAVRVLSGPPSSVVLVDGRVLRLDVSHDRGERRLSRGHEVHSARLGADESALDPRASASAAGLVVAPMPGRIVAVRVHAGELLEKGALLLVIEAMKMQNELFSSGAGRVEAVLVAAGDTVERGGPLIRIV